jgi:hypothetical protein
MSHRPGRKGATPDGGGVRPAGAALTPHVQAQRTTAGDERRGGQSPEAASRRPDRAAAPQPTPHKQPPRRRRASGRGRSGQAGRAEPRGQERRSHMLRSWPERDTMAQGTSSARIALQHGARHCLQRAGTTHAHVSAPKGVPPSPLLLRSNQRCHLVATVEQAASLCCTRSATVMPHAPGSQVNNPCPRDAQFVPESSDGQSTADWPRPPKDKMLSLGAVPAVLRPLPQRVHGCEHEGRPAGRRRSKAGCGKR